MVNYSLNSLNHVFSGGMYLRLDPELPRQILLDEIDAMDEIQQFARKVDITKTLQFVDEHFTYNHFNS